VENGRKAKLTPLIEMIEALNEFSEGCFSVVQYNGNYHFNPYRGPLSKLGHFEEPTDKTFDGVIIKAYNAMLEMKQNEK
jgi:hypothetical protein